ncbi:MAG: hypothetical protein H6741_03475 [Alphaproteobacteria bacterium]|nr:hypothetical protein [Alphaproteobacteria bacterium]MCB9791765.1 hypothetical protein [Alphaproteobacteria bacterium]
MLALLLMLACVPKTFPEDRLPDWEERPVTGTFNADFSKTWDATLTVLGDAAPLDEISKGDGVLTTGWVTDFSDYIFKNYGGTRIPEPIRWRMEVSVKGEGSRTVVTMVSMEQVEKDLISANLQFTGAVYSWIDVPSSTAKEQEFLEAILEEINRPESGADYDYDDYAR